jgi:hypothetical protein
MTTQCPVTCTCVPKPGEEQLSVQDLRVLHDLHTRVLTGAYILLCDLQKLVDEACVSRRRLAFLLSIPVYQSRVPLGITALYEAVFWCNAEAVLLLINLGVCLQGGCVNRKFAWEPGMSTPPARGYWAHELSYWAYARAGEALLGEPQPGAKALVLQYLLSAGMRPGNKSDVHDLQWLRWHGRTHKLGWILVSL